MQSEFPMPSPTLTPASRCLPGSARSASRTALACALLACAATVSTTAAADVYRCETTTGKVVFTDAPCGNEARGTRWSATPPSPGIAASGARGQAAAMHAVLHTPRQAPVTGRSEPWVDCRQRGGEFELAARVCRLPPDTVEHMFLAN